MKSTTTNSGQLDIVGSRSHQPAQEIVAATLKRCRQNLGYLSILATVPALMFPNIHEARTEEAKPTEANVEGKTARWRQHPKAQTTSELLKRQSKFRLSHQDGIPDLGAAPGPDDCPGQAITGGTYTAAAPYIQSGDTTGADDTISSLYAYYYFSGYPAQGPDHVYSFTLTSLGPNPKIEVSTTSGSYKPLIYVLAGAPNGVCPAGTGNQLAPWWTINDTRWNNNNDGTARLDARGLPLNVPLHLFIDSDLNDANGAGPYTIRMQDVTVAPTVAPNVIDDTEFFVRQQYLDFLNRPADAEGLAFWKNQITSCGGDQDCVEVKRINDSGAFFLSIEFQGTGYLAYRAYKAAYGNLPGAPVPINFEDFQRESKLLGQNLIVNHAGWEQVLDDNKSAFVLNFVQSPRFSAAYPTSMTPAEFIDRLFSNAGVTPTTSEREEAINEFGGAESTGDLSPRARTVRRVAENSTLAQMEFNRAFVLMQYFGYLRRNPNDAPDGNFGGYNFWLDKLDQFKGDFKQAEMVKAFLSSTEYRRRFAS